MHDQDGTNAPSQAGDLMGGPPILAELPNLEAPVSHRPAESGRSGQDGRFLGQRISTKLLVGLAGALVVLAIVPWLLKSDDSKSTDSDLPAWQTNMPAPAADEAPQWNSQPAETITPAVPTPVEPSGITAVDPMSPGAVPESVQTTPYGRPPELAPARVPPQSPPPNAYSSPPAYEGRYEPRPAQPSYGNQSSYGNQPGYGQVYANPQPGTNRPMRVDDPPPARTDNYRYPPPAQTDNYRYPPPARTGNYRYPPSDVNHFDRQAMPPARQMGPAGQQPDPRAAQPDRRWPQSAQTAPPGIPGVARLEGFIAKPPVRMTHDATRPRLH